MIIISNATKVRTLSVFEIRSEKDYDLAVDIQPAFKGITFEALKNHFFVLSSGELQFCTLPPGFLSENNMTVQKSGARDSQIVHLSWT